MPLMKAHRQPSPLELLAFGNPISVFGASPYATGISMNQLRADMEGPLTTLLNSPQASNALLQTYGKVLGYAPEEGVNTLKQLYNKTIGPGGLNVPSEAFTSAKWRRDALLELLGLGGGGK